MKAIAWRALVISVVLFSAGCSSRPAPAPEEPRKEVGTPTPVSNLPGKATATRVPERDRLDPEALAPALGNFVLRPADLPHDYRIPQNGEKRISNLGVIQRVGEVAGKHYIASTGRVEGWFLSLERKKKADFAPATFESTIELFESSDGALLAISPEWFKAYQEGNKTPVWIEDGCDLGDECLFYYYESLDPATNLTKLEYDVAFAYKNVVVWVMGRGLDIDVTPDYVLEAAEAVYRRLEGAS